LINAVNDVNYTQVKARLEGMMLDWFIRTGDVVPFDEDKRGF